MQLVEFISNAANGEVEQWKEEAATSTEPRALASLWIPPVQRRLLHCSALFEA